MEHDLRLVKLHGFGRDIEQRADFLDGPPLRDQLQHLSLARCQVLPCSEECGMVL